MGKVSPIHDFLPSFVCLRQEFLLMQRSSMRMHAYDLKLEGIPYVYKK